MTFREEGFRFFYHHFVAVELSDDLRPAMAPFIGGREASYALTYGYYDREAGLTLEILAAAVLEDGHFKVAEGNNEVTAKIRIEEVIDMECLYLPDEDGSIRARFAQKMGILKGYDPSEDVEKTRSMTFLDGCRESAYIDDLLVYLFKDGLQVEGCWVRITGLGEDTFQGVLLNEPNQAFGCHQGDTVSFFVQETDEKTYICILDMNKR